MDMAPSNLIPTPTVDKNGKQTTVYRKHKPESANAVPIPAPALSPAFVSTRDPRHLVIDAIWEKIQDGINRWKLPSYKDKMTDSFRNLSGTKNESYPAMVLEMVTAIMPTASATGIRAVIFTIADSDEDGARAMHAHRNYLSANPHSVSIFASMRKMLMETIGVTPDNDGRLPTIESHLYAKAQWDETMRRGNDSDVPHYRNMPDVIAMVEKHPSDVPALIEFLSRGQGEPSMQRFEEYLSQGAVREGSL